MKTTIRKFAYLKTPVFTWYVENDLGGGFSNSGNQKSLKKCLEHVKANVPTAVGSPYEVVSMNADETETVIERGTL